VGGARTGIGEFAADLRAWAPNATGRVPAYERLALQLADEVERDAALAACFAAAWGAREFPARYDRPLLAMAALRFDALLDARHPLSRAIAARTPAADAATPEALRAALDPAREKFWDAIHRRAVQTNETTRAVAWLWPAHLAGAGLGARPIALCDLGCSAGLNLAADLLPAPWTDATGARIPVAHGVHLVARRGFDRNPLDVSDPDAETWLRACLWPGEHAREDRFDAALVAVQALRARGEPIVLERCEAEEMPARLAAWSAALPPGTFVLASQTVMREYLPAEIAARYAGGLREWVASRAPGSAAWIELETAATPGALPAALTAHVATGGAVIDLELARIGYHPTAVAIDARAAEAFARAVAPRG